MSATPWLRRQLPRLLKAEGWWLCGTPVPGKPGLLDTKGRIALGVTPGEAWAMWALLTPRVRR
jgi:hypothetical protein